MSVFGRASLVLVLSEAVLVLDFRVAVGIAAVCGPPEPTWSYLASTVFGPIEYEYEYRLAPEYELRNREEVKKRFPPEPDVVRPEHAEWLPIVLRVASLVLVLVLSEAVLVLDYGVAFGIAAVCGPPVPTWS